MSDQDAESKEATRVDTISFRGLGLECRATGRGIYVVALLIGLVALAPFAIHALGLWDAFTSVLAAPTQFKP